MPTEKEQKKADPVKVIGQIAVTAVVAMGLPLMYYMGYKHGVDVEYTRLHTTVGEAGEWLCQKVVDALKDCKDIEWHQF